MWCIAKVGGSSFELRTHLQHLETQHHETFATQKPNSSYGVNTRGVSIVTFSPHRILPLVCRIMGAGSLHADISPNFQVLRYRRKHARKKPLRKEPLPRKPEPTFHGAPFLTAPTLCHLASWLFNANKA